jgi:hypothetical protein
VAPPRLLKASRGPVLLALDGATTLIELHGVSRQPVPVAPSA